jgi:hypothetical protein
MKIYKQVAIFSMDVKTLTPNPNAKVFKDKYSSYAIAPTEYKFYDKNMWESAEEDIIKLGLRNSSGFDVEFDNDDEFKNYPVFILAIYPEFELAEQQNGVWFVNAKAMKKHSFCMDLRSEELFVNLKAKSFFEKNISGLTFEEAKSSNQKDNYYRMSGIPILEYPTIIKKASAIVETERKGFFDAEKTEGLTSFSKEAISQITKNKISVNDKFSFNSKEYKQINRHVVSGEFAFKLKEEFKKEDNTVQFTPVILDYI